MEKKIYGVYPGSIKNLEEVENYSELELFLAIYSLESYILSYKRIVAYNMIKGVDTQESEYALEYLINKTQKFGVEIEKDSIGKSIRIGDYASWYEYYLTYVSSILNKEEFAKVIREKEEW